MEKHEFTLEILLGKCIKHPDDLTQILTIEGYNIEYDVMSYKTEGNNPAVSCTMNLEGIPHSNLYEVTSAELRFYGDERQNQKPYYNASLKRISAFYPIGSFDGFLSMLNHKHSQLDFLFHECIQFEDKQVLAKLFVSNSQLNGYIE